MDVVVAWFSLLERSYYTYRANEHSGRHVLIQGHLSRCLRSLRSVLQLLPQPQDLGQLVVHHHQSMRMQDNILTLTNLPCTPTFMPPILTSPLCNRSRLPFHYRPTDAPNTCVQRPEDISFHPSCDAPYLFAHPIDPTCDDYPSVCWFPQSILKIAVVELVFLTLACFL
jgi:hypothetical protein